MPRYLSKTFFINFLFSLIPLSFIAGNLILNLNIIILIILTLIFYKIDVFRIKINYIDKIILVFFIYTLIIAFVSTIDSYSTESNSKDFTILIKTFAFLRYLLFYFIIRHLINKNIINFKIFFMSCSACVVFVCLDLIAQFYFGKDIFGYEPIHPRRMSGPFGDELIAGSYLQRFSLFLFFLFPIFWKWKNEKLLKILIVFLIFLVLLASILAGNRMPFILLILSIILIILFEKPLRKYLIPFILFFSIIFSTTYKFNSDVKVHFDNFYVKTNWIISSLSNTSLNTNDKAFGAHYKEFYAGYETWKQNKFFGKGIKSFKRNCSKKIINCGPHPHNYYLEILAELGLMGFLLLSLIFLSVLYESLFKKYFLQSNLKFNYRITPFIFLFFVEIFPLKTTGSFFTTGNASFVFMLVAIIIALSREQDLN
jgi:O-antigen ligase